MSVKKENKKDEILEDALHTLNEGEAAYFLSEWIGAVFVYLIRFGNIPFQKVIQRKNRSRNVCLGWVIQILFTAITIWTTVLLMN